MTVVKHYVYQINNNEIGGNLNPAYLMGHPYDDDDDVL